nr:MAG TPA_asm: hypothetical protein [Bacteriophage sp.]
MNCLNWRTMSFTWTIAAFSGLSNGTFRTL